MKNFEGKVLKIILAGEIVNFMCYILQKRKKEKKGMLVSSRKKVVIRWINRIIFCVAFSRNDINYSICVCEVS